MLSVHWFKDALERALSTAAEALLALWGVGALDVVHIDFGHSASIAAGAAVVSLLKAIVASKVGDQGTASLVSTPGRHALRD